MDMDIHADSLTDQLPANCDSGQLLPQMDGSPVKTKPRIRKINANMMVPSYLNTADVDFVFDVHGIEEVVPAHKCILAFHSPVFRQMFYGELKEKGEIKLTDTTVDAFVDLMQCMYEFQLKIESKIDDLHPRLLPLLDLAHKYDVNWLEKECQRILDQIIDCDLIAILWVLPLVKFYSFNEMQRKCTEKIYAYGRFIMESTEFVDCDVEIMKIILGTSFVGRNEVHVLEICIKWAKRACEKAGLDPESPENIRHELNDIFSLIRFGSMTAQQFVQCLSMNPGLFTPNEIHQIACNISETIQPNKRPKCEKDNELKDFQIVSPFNTVESSLQLLLQDQSTANFTFVFKNDANEETERIPAHKYILAQESEIFEKQLIGKTNTNEEILITGVSAEVFMYFLRLMYVIYNNQILAILQEIDDQHFDALLTLNEKYLRKSLPFYKSMYTNHLIISLNEQNVLRRLELSQKHSLDELKKECIDLMKKKGELIINSEAFMDCSQENLKVILELGIWEGEKTMAIACIKWAKNFYKLESDDPKELRMVMGDLFALIPFVAMGLTTFVDLQSEYRGMLTADEVLKLINEFSDRRKSRSSDLINID